MEEEKRAKAAASVYEQMRLKAMEDSKAEAAAKIKAAKEAKVMEELMKKKEELESKIGMKQTKPKTSVAEAAPEEVPRVMGQRELAKKKKEEMEKKAEEYTENTKVQTESKEVKEKKAFSQFYFAKNSLQVFKLSFVSFIGFRELELIQSLFVFLLFY